ncbi:MAG: hypothetical protein HND48_13560 [Chloroflexi bacterium]|nr:hypothetical protein [Chloroflexota bacterium]
MPSLTPTPTETHTPGPTPEPQVIVVTNTPDPNELAQLTMIAQVVEATIDPIILDVTLTVAAATGIPLTQTAEAGINFQLPTLTPTFDPTLSVFPDLHADVPDRWRRRLRAYRGGRAEPVPHRLAVQHVVHHAGEL